MSTAHTTVYGIKACDTMKKAMTWLDSEGIAYDFHDYKKQGIDAESIKEWLTLVPWDELINRRGTTWRKLSDADKQDVDNEKALNLMLANQSLIKRPLLSYEGKVYLGFKPEMYATIFG